MIQQDKYVSNSLRKGRTQAFENDLEKVYGHFINCHQMPELITISDFEEMWTLTNMNYIFQCVCEEQDEEEFAQHLYEIIIKKYFSNKQKNLKIFSIFCLYFSFYACERLRKICMSKTYIDELTDFIKTNKEDNDAHFLKVCWHLCHKCIQPCTKIGLRNAIVKFNGQPARKTPIIRVEPLGFSKDFNKKIDAFENDLNEYSKLKEKVKEQGVNFGDCQVDIFFIERIKNLLHEYENNVDQEDD